MKITVNQNVKKYTVNAVQLVKSTNVIVQPLGEQKIKVSVSQVKRSNIITIAQLGARGIQGISAYDIAVNNGFVGTQSEWLRTLIPTNVDGGIFF